MFDKIEKTPASFAYEMIRAHWKFNSDLAEDVATGIREYALFVVELAKECETPEAWEKLIKKINE